MSGPPGDWRPYAFVVFLACALIASGVVLIIAIASDAPG